LAVLVDSLYAEAKEAVNSHAKLSVSSPYAYDLLTSIQNGELALQLFSK
jgi:hypothetical protein